ncbi:MAG: YARHG domain-containing protein [Ruminococcus sp.]|nr:YARHG domain-containing protein [Ruminococcus sp.]
MSRFVKLPENLKSWKIISRLSEDNDNELYKISKKEYDGTTVSANLRYVTLCGDEYTSENVDFITEEAAFLKGISKSGDSYNYIDIVVVNTPAKEKLELFIITEDLKSLSEVMDSKSFDENEIIDFGIQMSAILEKLEANSIYHGNLSTKNIFVTSDNKYKIGGFSDFESKISDFSFVAPEIHNKKDADFTTDIYSLGLIMYYMSNNYSLPFESENVIKDDAIKMRLDGKSVTAPAHGSEKLKSVIVIACQPNNENRWKNAGNIKNALTSIKSESITSKPENLIIPETTDFDGNVFEEFEYEEFDSDANSANEVFPVASAIENNTPISEEIQPEPVNAPAEETPVIEVAQDENESDFVESNFEVEEVTEIFEPENDKIVTESTTEIPVPEIIEEPVSDNDVFDNFEVQKKAKSFQQQAKEKDYGDYFEENVSAQPKTETPEKTEYDVDNDKEYNVFEEELDNEPAESTGNRKKNAVIIAISVIVILAALGFVAFCIISGISGKSNTSAETTAPETTVATEIATTEPVTTIPTTTVAPTTISAEKNVIPVVGYGYSYAKKLLEQEGFVVQEGNYEYSSEWPAGYVIAQSPEGNATASSGAVVTLDISLGPEEVIEETEAAVEESSAVQAINNNTGSDDYIFANSASAYLSESEVSSLSRENLNLALNEIYARRGRIFKDSSLSAYFNSKSWYEPKYTSDEFSKYVTFNKYEQANLNLIINEQKEKGYR